MGLLDSLVSGVTSAVKAYSEAKKKKSASSSSSSSASNTTSNNSGYIPKGSNTDAYIKESNIDDYNAIQSAKRAYEEAAKLGDKTGMANANSAANEIRKKYGYSGGEDGSEYIPLQQNNNTYKDYENPYEEAMKNVQERYDALAEQQRKANELAVKQGTQRLESQKYNINQSYDNSARQAYIANMQAKKNLPQQLAASGITGGASETTNLGIQTNYENNLTDINTNRNKALNDIDNAIIDLQNSGDLNATQQALESSQAALNAYQNLLQEKINYDTNREAQNLNAELSTLGQYYDDYQAEINRREAINPNDPLIPYLKAARQEKINAQRQAEQEAYNAELAQQQSYIETQRELAWKLFQETGISNSFIESVLGIPLGTTTLDYTKNRYDTNKPYYNPYSSSSRSSKGNNNDEESFIPDAKLHKNIIESRYAIKDIGGNITGYDTDGILNYIMQESQKGNMTDEDVITLLYTYGLKEEADSIR